MEVTNVRISKDDIKFIAQILYERCLHFEDLYKQKLEHEKQYKYGEDDTIFDVVVGSKPRISFSITIKNETDTRDDFDWFVSTLFEKSSVIEKVEIDYGSYYRKNVSMDNAYGVQMSEESINISFRPDYIYYTKNKQNPVSSFEDVISQVDNTIYNAPSSCDKIILGKNARKTIPSITRGLWLGIVLSIVAFCTFSLDLIQLPIDFNFISILTPIIVFAISLLIGLSLAGPNHSLYRRLNIKKKYVGYSTSSKSSIYADDISGIKSMSEVEIGKKSNNGRLREKIEQNYKHSKKILFIQLFVMIAIIILYSI